MHRIRAAALAAAMLIPTLLVAGGNASNRTWVFLDPAPSSFWHTVTNTVMSLPVDLPQGAARATLEVSAPGYSATYSDLTDGLFELTLPEATSPDTENVYDLTLSFLTAGGQPVGEPKAAKLGFVRGEGAKSATTECRLTTVEKRRWCRAGNRTVIPIPYGTRSLTVNGSPVDTGLGDDQGWYALTGIGTDPKQIVLDVEGELQPREVIVLGFAGLLFLVR